jgi:hypothetical protein
MTPSHEPSRGVKPPRPRLLLGVLAGFIGALALAAAALAVGDGAPLTGGGGAGETKQPVASVPGDLESSFGVFRRPRGAHDVLPRSAAAFPATEPSPTGENTRYSRRAATLPAGGALYVVPGDGAVCVFLAAAPGGSGGCGPTGRAIRGEWTHASAGSAVGLGAGDQVIYGLSPDGVDNVRVDVDGNRRTVVVEDNVWWTVAPVGADVTVTVGQTTVRAVSVPKLALSGA